MKVEIDSEELDRLRESERDLTRRLTLALKYLAEIAEGRGHSRMAIQAWIISLAIPAPGRPKPPAADVPGEIDLLRGARDWQQDAHRTFTEAGDIAKLPPHAAVAVLSDGIGSMHAAMSSLIAYFEEKRDAKDTRVGSAPAQGDAQAEASSDSGGEPPAST